VKCALAAFDHVLRLKGVTLKQRSAFAFAYRHKITFPLSDNLRLLQPTFWSEDINIEPEDVRVVVCHPTVDSYNGLFMRARY
jgi:hypothetical protein